MAYKIEFLPAAAKDLRKLSRILSQDQMKAIKTATDALADDPWPPGASEVKRHPGLLRFRKGDYRVVYQPKDKVLQVLVVAVGDRRDIYEVLRRRVR